MSFTYYKVMIVLLTVFIGSSGRPVAQSMIVCTPTKVAGIVSGLLRSPCSETSQEFSSYKVDYEERFLYKHQRQFWLQNNSRGLHIHACQYDLSL